jgi:Phospholipase_D-nuclease N-terminal
MKGALKRRALSLLRAAAIRASDRADGGAARLFGVAVSSPKATNPAGLPRSNLSPGGGLVLAALVLLLGFALLAGWEVLCLGDLLRADRVRLLPRWAWAIACLIFIPLGGVLYLLAGRVWARGPAC